MKKRALSLAIALRQTSTALILILAANAHAQQAMVAKQLAGAPEEFAAMQPANPADAAIQVRFARKEFGIALSPAFRNFIAQKDNAIHQ